MRISDWSSDVCSSDLGVAVGGDPPAGDGVDPASTVGGMETGVFGVLNQRDGIAEAVLGEGVPDGGGVCGHAVRPLHLFVIPDRTRVVSGKRVSVRVNLCGCRSTKNNNDRHLIIQILYSLNLI